ncbi:(4Fe-4S)-binding protein [Candidatus Thorarchaeota archaeon]|nr:MAG: (4Fe-4S)-binding protein [Candidatus Thorarchaeota archaeon]
MVDEIAVLSGKGGTGKTTITGAFAALAQNKILADCDVDAPDLHILLHPKVIDSNDFVDSSVAYIDPSLCVYCGVCEEKCRFDAINPPNVNKIACEGCGVCAYVCPEGAIEMRERVSGHLFKSETRFGAMSHAKLLPGEGNSGKLVTAVRKQAENMAEREKKDHILIDGSPGIGCPVIATVTGLSTGVVVTEPTPSGIHDMNRIIKLMLQFKVKPLIIINKFDLNEDKSAEIKRAADNMGVTMLGRIPFDPIMTKSMVAAQTLPEYAPENEIVEILENMWKKIMSISGS